MTANEKTLNTFTTRVRQMILNYKEVKKENNDLYAMVDARDAEIKRLQQQLSQAQSDYNSLKMAKMLTITDGDMESAQKRMAKLIRDVNKCITLLGEK
jgi:chromosome segregation ATPase